MAPLRGITDDDLREAFDRHFGGFDGAIAPFLTPMGRGGPRDRELRRAAAAARAALPAVPQVLTGDADDLIRVLRRLADVGCDEVSWNLGCPHPPVVRKGRGAGLLTRPDRVAAILDRLMPSCSVRLTVKMRVGVDRPDQGLAILEVLDRYPIGEITIHPRRAVQLYEGPVDLDAFGEHLSATRHPVVYNGDVVDLVSHGAVLERFPAVAGVMIGRGALWDPALPAAIRGRPVDDRAERIRRFHDDLYRAARRRLSGPGHLLGRMKGLWEYLARAVDADPKILKKLKKSRTPEEYERLAARLLT